MVYSLRHITARRRVRKEMELGVGSPRAATEPGSGAEPRLVPWQSNANRRIGCGLGPRASVAYGCHEPPVVAERAGQAPVAVAA